MVAVGMGTLATSISSESNVDTHMVQQSNFCMQCLPQDRWLLLVWERWPRAYHQSPMWTHIWYNNLTFACSVCHRIDGCCWYGNAGHEHIIRVQCGHTYG